MLYYKKKKNLFGKGVTQIIFEVSTNLSKQDVVSKSAAGHLAEAATRSQ